MRVLVTGAYGFLGAHIAARLHATGHEVTGCGRDLDFGRRILPGLTWIACDYNRDVTAATWAPRLQDIDAVVNCVGILQGTRRDSADRIHRQAPAALFAACEQAGLRRVIQVSALGVEADTDYARTKAAGDQALRSTGLDWVILKPSLVYGRGAYGGTALLRGLAGLPGIVAVIDGGGQQFQPVHIDDLAAVVGDMLEPGAPRQTEIAVVGPETLTVRDIVLTYRRWLGFPDAPVISVPAALGRIPVAFGDLAGWLGTATAFRSTALAQMIHGSVNSPAGVLPELPDAPARMAEALAAKPATVQDRWHARLYFLKPLLRIALGVFWLATGIITLLPPGFAQATAIAEQLVPHGNPAALLAGAGAAVDIVLGLMLLVRYRVIAVGWVQIAITLLYLILVTAAVPSLWGDALGPMVKVMPILAATLIMIAIERER
jgi:uncharacterized protein YbjT (DUF2867 family)